MYCDEFSHSLKEKEKSITRTHDVPNGTEVIQAGDCAPYQRTGVILFSYVAVSAHNGTLCSFGPQTEALLKGNFSYMYHE